MKVDRRQLAWALYDWANSAFATTVMAGFFPIFFKEYWNSGVAATESSYRLGLTNAIAGLMVAICAPLLGALADRAGARKRFLAFSIAIGTLPCAALWLVAEGDWMSAALLYATAIFGFSTANTFYDALLVDVAGEGERDRVSAFGYALGYLGGGLLFAVNVAMALQPHWFGLADAAEAVRVSLLMAACWWLLFALPLFLWVEEGPAAEATGRSGWSELRWTIRQAVSNRTIALFLLAYWLYIDGVDTIIRMAVDFGLALGFASSDLITALLITQLVGFPAALVYGRLGERYGTRNALLAGIGVYIVMTIWAARIESSSEFYAMALLIGLVQGGVQALSRSLYSRLIPVGRSAAFFGLFNMLGKFAVVLGPLLMGQIALATGDSRSSVYGVTLLLIAGGAILIMLPLSPKTGSGKGPYRAGE